MTDRDELFVSMKSRCCSVRVLTQRGSPEDGRWHWSVLVSLFQG
ncbi:MAG TPA: hypothetical protein VGM98_01825 [Schlesneria sp.]